MTFSISPTIRIREIDATVAPSAVSTTEGAIAGVFKWGPVMERVRVSSEAALEDTFFKPTDFNAETWLTANSFLAYSNTLYAVRVVSDDAKNSGVGQKILDRETAELLTGLSFIGRYPGELGNALTVSVAGPAQYSSDVKWVWADRGTNIARIYDDTGDDVQVGDILTLGDRRTGVQTLRVLTKATASATTPAAIADGRSNKILSARAGETGQVIFKTYGPHGYSVGDFVTLTGTSTITPSTVTGEIVAANSTEFTLVTSITQNNLDTYVAGTATAVRVVDPSWSSGSSVSTTTLTLSGNITLPRDVSGGRATRSWGYSSSVGSAPAVNHMHVVVVDRTGEITGQAGTVLETYQNLSTTAGERLDDGTNNFYRQVINGRSKWVYATSVVPSVASGPTYTSLADGTDGDDETSIAVGRIAEGYDMFASGEDVDISVIMQGRASDATLSNYIISNVVLKRMDCVLTASPPKEAVLNNRGNEVDSILEWRSGVMNTSYVIFDSGYKYQYDKWNDVYRWVPLNGDIAGLCAMADPWDSPAANGQIRNCYGLAFNPTSKFDRDALYARDVNSVMTKTGKGAILFGDKTGLGVNSAFSRINVRRLFVYVEKMVANYAETLLFKNNTNFTRQRFLNAIEPRLRDIQGQGGMIGFKMVCDESINTPSVIDDFTLRADIFIKPPRTINYIDLRFVAVPTGVTYEEVETQLNGN